MERSKVIQSGLKKMATVLFLAAALASTGCSQNALLNPTPQQVQAAGNGAYSAVGNQMNPAGQIKTSATNDMTP